MNGTVSWEHRRVLEEVRLHAIQLTATLSSFDQTIKAKLVKLDEKLTKIERSLTYQCGEKILDQE